MYPFTNTIGEMKVSQALPLLGFIANDWKLDVALVPDHPEKIHDVVWRGTGPADHLTIATRILKNSQRKN